VAEKTKETKKKSSNKSNKKNATNPVTRYIRETRGELRKVTWPTRQESQRLTAIVIAVSAAMAVFLWFWDLIFSRSIHFVINSLI
jgi:preprotein translocase subunit SecE